MSEIDFAFQNVVTISEAAALGIYSKSHLVLLCEMGAVLGRKSGKFWLIWLPSLNDYVKNQQTNGQKRQSSIGCPESKNAANA